MPRLQKLIERYNKRVGVQFVTLNVDEEPGLNGPFMQKNGFTFPVLLAYDYARNTLKVCDIPQDWVVDGSSIVRMKGTGYDPTDEYDKWQKGITAAIREYAPASVIAAPSSDK